MKAVVKKRPAVGLEVSEVEIPALGPNDVLIEVKATSICGSDVNIYNWDVGYRWMKLPIIVGHEFSGIVVDVGEKVEEINAGVRVVCNPIIPCWKCILCKSGKTNICISRAHLGLHRDGSFAEFVSIPKNIAGIYEIPRGVSYETASLLEPFCTALHAIEQSGIKPGDSALVLGPGPMGLLTLQALKLVGATPIIVAGLSSDKTRLNMAKNLGASLTFRVDVESIEDVVMSETNSLGVDFVFEATGNPKAIGQAISAVKNDGKVMVIGIFPDESRVYFTSIVRREIKLSGVYAYTDLNWRTALKLVSKGKVNLERLITNKLKLDEALEGIMLMKERKALKVILYPTK